MIPFYEDAGATVYHGDCIEVMRALPDASVDAIVTDPPYGLEFMGRDWDGADGFRRSLNAADAGRDNVFGRSSRTSPEYKAGELFGEWCALWATEALRVLKPGGHLVAFGGSRTWHRLAVGIEEAGFELRDSIAWLYGSGFPKSMDVAQAIDKLDAFDERLERARVFQSWLREYLTPRRVNELTGTDMGYHLTTHPTQPAVATAEIFDLLRPELPTVPDEIEQLVADRTVESKNYAAREVVGIHRSGVSRGAAGVTAEGDGKAKTASHTPEAAAWEGWGTALKPAFEPIVVGRKPLAGTVAANVLAHGTGAINIDATRVATDEILTGSGSAPLKHGGMNSRPFHETAVARGVQQHEAGRWPTNVVLDESQAAELDRQTGVLTSGKMNAGQPRKGKPADILGSFAPDEVRNDTYGDSGGASRFFPTFRYEAKAPSDERPSVDGVQHPTVKPLDLMRWLVRLVTPPQGVVLEPFAGSGTTIQAALLEGFSCIGIEREDTYLPLILQRIRKPMQQDLFDLFGEAS